MKTHFSIWIATIVLTNIGLLCEAQNVASQPTPVQTINVPASTPYAITTQDGNSRVWQRMTYDQSLSGEVVTNVHSYTELATGLNHLVNGQWVESKEEIDILPNGTAVATNGQHQAYFPGDIYEGQIELVTPDGQHLKSRPIGLSYFDGTNSVLIAELTNSIGVVSGNNQVIYPDAFTDFKADLRYTYTKAGFEQDIILKEQPPTPESLGLNPDTARLQVLTEFFDPPQPTVSAITVPTPAGDLENDNLDFVMMQMVQGRAFLLGDEANDVGAPVNKQWLLLDGRQILVEEVPVDAIAEGLATLPLPTAQSSSTTTTHVVSKHLTLPSQRLAKTATKPMLLARASVPTQGFVLDYNTINSSMTNYTFQGDMTYYISGSVNLYGTNTFEGGTVLKYTNGASINISAGCGINWLGAPYRPVILTAKDDNSVGDAINGSTGNPTNYYASWALNFNNAGPFTLSNFRISYATNAIGDYETDLNLYDGQFVNNQFGVEGIYYANTLRNVLMVNVSTNFTSVFSSIDSQNSTFSGSVWLDPNASFGSLSFKNCVFANVTNLTSGTSSTLTGTNNGFYKAIEFGTDTVTNSFYPFQTVGAGSYYLTNGCAFTNAGTTNIDATLLASLKQKTTYPPLLLTNQSVSINTTLNPQAQRDTDTPDLGYHYDPIDYLLDYFQITNATLTVTNGTAIASYNEPGVMLTDGSSIVSIGSPLYPNWFVRYSSAQEEPLSLGALAPSGAYDINPYHFSVAPSGQYRFTKFACPAGGGTHLYDGEPGSPSWVYTNLWVQDCEFWGGGNTFSGGSNMVIVLKNNLFARSTFSANVALGSSASFLALTNNLFWETSMLFHTLGAPGWSAYDNDFDSSTISFGMGANNTITNGYNAYLNCTNRLNPTNAFDIVTNVSLAYQTGPLGTFYQPTNSPLINKGSTNANLLGLYHFTTQTNQTVEGNSTVDIGYHYVAVDANGNPLDYDSDGIPDYIEDANGNGLDDSGESPWDLGIISQPQTQNVVQGQNASFSVTVGGTGPFSYQWQFNGANISGATSSTYTKLVVQTNDAGNYSVVVSNTTASVTSSNAVLMVTIPLAITSQPVGQTVVQGTNVSFSVGVSGNYLVYQWYGNGVPLSNGARITGATSSTVTISSAAGSDTGSYYVIVTNLFGSVTSSSVTLTVITNPAIASPPTDTTAIQSDDVTFSVSASGSGIGYQWWLTNSLETNLVATTQNYTKLVVQTNDAGHYSVIVTNAAGSTNAHADLTVWVPPWIVQQPSNVLTNQGSNATFTVTAIGTTNLSYQWFKNGTNAIVWGTNASLTLTNVQTVDAAGYSVLVTNVAGTNFSAWAWLSVIQSARGGGTNYGWGSGGSPPSVVPTVSMISPTNASPTNAAVFLYGPPISIRASASSQYGYVTNVAFYFTGTNYGTNFMLAGTAVPGPNTRFALAWTNALPGTNILRAVAWDNSGVTATSSVVYVIMAVAPTISAGPDTNVVWTEGASGTNISFIGNVTDDGRPYSWVTNVQWSVVSGNASYATISNPGSLATQITFTTNGVYSLQLQVDNNFATNTSTCKVTILRRPKLYFNAPTNNALLLTGTPIVLNATATAYAPAGTVTNIQFYTNSVLMGTGIQSVNNTYTFLWNNAPLWTNLLTAVATDNDGLTSSTNITVVVVPPLDVRWLAPTNNQLFILSPTNILLSAQAISYIGATVTNVSFSNQLMNLGAGVFVTNSTWQFLWQDATNGTYTLTVNAADNQGHTAGNSVTITVNAMPVVSIVTPTNFASFLEVTNIPISVTTTDSDGYITNVAFYNHGTFIGSNSISPFGLTWSNLYPGVYPITAVATDNRGARGVSFITDIRVNPTNAYPTVAITFPTNNEVFADGSDLIITAVATNYPATVTNVEFFVNGRSIGSNPNPPYEMTECCLEPGSYQLSAVATDNTGSSSISSYVQITVSQEAPVGQGFWDATFYPFSTGTLWPLGGWDFTGYPPYANSVAYPFPSDSCGNQNLIPEINNSAVVYGSDYYCVNA